jgi:hypothetical protein
LSQGGCAVLDLGQKLSRPGQNVSNEVRLLTWYM